MFSPSFKYALSTNNSFVFCSLRGGLKNSDWLKRWMVTVWFPSSDAFVAGQIMCAIGFGHLGVFYGGQEGSEAAVLV